MTSITDSLSDTDLHLLLAGSGQENLLIQLQELQLLDSLHARIADFCSSPSINRSLHVLPQDLGQTADEESEVLEQFFITSNEGKKETQGQLPQVLVIPSLEEYPRHLQLALKAVLRDKRFEYDGKMYNLPKDFVLIGVATDWEKMPSYMIDVFGLSLQLDDIPDSASASNGIPPLVPVQPPAFHAPMLRVYTADVLSALRHHPLLQNTLITTRCSFGHIFKIATLWARLKTSSNDVSSASDKPALTYARDIEIRPQDIIDILPSCVMHRLRTRPPDERLDRLFWNKDKPVDEETQKMDDAIRAGARLRYDLILQEVLDKV